MKINDILEKWRNKNRRHFWWREKRDVYSIWIGEIIFQQTRIGQGNEYLKRFLDRFPDVVALASAPPGEVMKMWAGLGYYARAQNLHRAAVIIVNEMKGMFPESYSGWLSIPGVGPYTAAVIASLVSGEKKAAADGNIQRVVARWKLMPYPAGSIKLMNEVTVFLEKEIRNTHPGLFNEAMMDFGATVCLPRNPICNDCPFRKLCLAYRDNKTTDFPVKKKAVPKKVKRIYYLIVPCRNGIVMRKRQGMGIWESLHDFPSLEYDTPWPAKRKTEEDMKTLLRKNNGFKVIKKVRHELTHRRLQLYFLLFNKGTLLKRNNDWFCADEKTMQQLAFPIPVENILKSLKNNVSLFL
jgi:A/G-specific adenine glycosylase